MSVFFAIVTGNDVAGIGIKAADLTLRGFSREQETKADEFGLSIVNAEYGHVNEAWRLFERWAITDNSFIDLVSYLSTHPDSGERIADMRSLAEEKGWLTVGEITALRWQQEKSPVTFR